MYMRHVGILYFLNKASILYNDDEIRTMPFNTNDIGSDKKEYSMTYDKRKPYLKKYCGPDWTCYHWPCSSVESFQKTRDEIIDKSNKEATINRIAWYGNIHSPLPHAIEYKTRPLLKQIGDKHRDIFHIVHVEPIPNEKKQYVISKKNKNYISMSDLTKYTFLIDIGGNGYSGRLKYLMFTKRPILLVDRNYVEYFHDDLKPYIHYIPVKMDLSDLMDQIRWIVKHPEECKQIAMNAFEYAMNEFTEDKWIKKVYDVYKNVKNI
jgi:hypothetical protein